MGTNSAVAHCKHCSVRFTTIHVMISSREIPTIFTPQLLYKNKKSKSKNAPCNLCKWNLSLKGQNFCSSGRLQKVAQQLLCLRSDTFVFHIWLSAHNEAGAGCRQSRDAVITKHFLQGSQKSSSRDSLFRWNSIVMSKGRFRKSPSI